MKKNIDLSSWNHREHFQFFSQFEEPFFGIVSDLDCSIAYMNAKKLGVTYFLYSLHKILSAVNAIAEFTYRIEEGKVVSYDTIHASPTIGRDDGTFGFAFFDFKTDLNEFIATSKIEIDRVKMSEGLMLDENTKRLDTVHFSSIPWIKFTGLSHARSFSFKDSVPKISVGKLSHENQKVTMPIAINVHHGLVDGWHVSKLLELIQFNLDH